MGLTCVLIRIEGEDFPYDFTVVAARRGFTNFSYTWLSNNIGAGFVGPLRKTVFLFIEANGLSVIELGESRIFYGKVEGYVADLPAPPLLGVSEDGEFVWTKFTTISGGKPHGTSSLLLTEKPAISINSYDWLKEDATLIRHKLLLALRYTPSLIPQSGDLYKLSLPCVPDFGVPWGRKLIGEEYRVKEVDGDYLRLVGRGKEEYLAWDFVLGTLDSGEWVLMGEDGLYVASLRGDRVIVERPFLGEIYDVRGPPYAPFYPVVPVKWVRERLERGRRLADRWGINMSVDVPPVEPVFLLKWPLVKFQWEFRVVRRFATASNISVTSVGCAKVCEYAEAAGANINCGEYLNALLRAGESVRLQTAGGAVGL